MHLRQGKPIEIRRSDVQRLLAYPKPDRDQLIHNLAAHMGFRTREIATAKREHINLDEGTIFILDSKKLSLYPIPIDYETATLIQHVMGEETEGLLIQRWSCYHGKTKNDPLTDTDLWHLVRRYACISGIPNWDQYNLRLLRHFFAATFAKGRNNKPGNLEALRRILRHKSLTYTQIYLARLIFYEDVQEEFNRLQTIPQIRRNDNVTMLVNEDSVSPRVSSIYKDQCCLCEHEPVCKYTDQALANEWAEACRYFKPKETIE